MKNSTLLGLVVAAFMAAVMGGCGGGGDGGTSAPPPPAATAEVPASASTSVGGFVSYLMALIGADADSLEPVDVSMVTPSVSDDTPPATVD